VPGAGTPESTEDGIDDAVEGLNGRKLVLHILDQCPAYGWDVLHDRAGKSDGRKIW
jgi:hypothetical protein